MKKLLRISLIFMAFESLWAAPQEWRCSTGGVVQEGRVILSSSDAPRDFTARRSLFWKVEPGLDYTVTVRITNELTAGQVVLELHSFSGYDGTPASVRQMKKISVIPAGRAQAGESSGQRTWICSLTVPSEVTALQARVTATEITGKFTFEKAALTQGDNTLAIPMLMSLPELNGKLDPEFAAKALTLKDFLAYPLKDQGLDDEHTEGYLAMSNTDLFATFLMKQTPGIAWVGEQRTRDHHAMWRDDSIEFFITHVGGNRPLYLIIINTLGCIYDSMNEGTQWDADLETAASHQEDGTAIIQFRMPLRNLGFIPGTDDNIVDPLWRINVRRNHAKCADRLCERQSTLAPIRETFDFPRYLRIRRQEKANPITYSANLYTEAGLVAREKQERFWKVKKPQFQELLSDQKPPLYGEGAIFWYHPFDPAMLPFALQHGLRWSQEDFGKIFAEKKLHLFAVYDIMVDWADVATTKPGCGAVIHAPVWLDDWTFPEDPKIRKKVVDTLQKSIQDRPGMVWCVTPGDELVVHFQIIIMRRANDPAYVKNHPAFAKMLEIIKRDYGFGKYGVPEQGEGNPFALLALRRFMSDQCLLLQHDIKQMLLTHEKETGEKILLLAQDPIGYTPDEYISRLARECDIMTLQNGPAHHPHRQLIAFRTQLVRDLSQRPVWPCTHVESYLGHYSPEEVVLAYSEAVRGGATGFQIFDSDTRGKIAKSGDTRICYYGHRARWDAMIDTANLVRSLNTLKFPEPSFGFFYSSDTQYSTPAYDVIPPEIAYNIAGPGAGAYFRIFDDIQLEDNDVKLEDWRLVFLPDASVEREAVSRKFLDYVKNGGTVFCFDPLVFSHGIDGTDTSSIRQELFGTKTIAQKHSGAITLNLEHPFWNGQTTPQLPLFQSDTHLECLPGTETLATFADGMPAITLKTFPGGGKALLFGFSIGKVEPVQNQSAWHNCFRAIFKNLNIPVDEPIWNFSIPVPEEYLTVKPTLPTRQCLTGNYFFWFDNTPQKLGNASLPGATYTLTLPPDSDQTGTVTFPFETGNLTNRLASLLVPNIHLADNRPLIRAGKLHMGMFVDTWKNTDAFEVRFHFPQPVTVEQLRIYFSNILPDYQVSCDGGRTFIQGQGQKTQPLSDEILALFEANNQEPDINIMLNCRAGVGEAELEIPAQVTSEVILKFAQRPAGEKMVLSEIEIWGRK